MPTYRVETNQGTFEIEANREPTASEIAQHISGSASAAAPVAATPAPVAPAPAQNDIGARVDAFLDTKPMQAQMAKFGVGALRAAPVVAAVAAPPVGLAGYLALAGIGATGEGAARAMEGKSVMSREGAAEMGKAAVLAGAPIPKVVPTNSFLGAVGQGAKQGVAAAATNATAESLRRTVEQGHLATYDKIAEGMKDNALPTALSFVAGAAGSRLGGLAEKKAVFDESRQRLADVGVQPENTTLAMLDPSKAGWENQVAARNPELAQKIGTAQSDITKKFYATIGDAPANSAIAERLQPVIGKVDAAERALQDAEKAHQAAITNFQKLSEAAAAAPSPSDALNKAYAQASADLMTAVAAKAKARYAAGAAVGDFVTNTEKASELTKTVGELFDARTEIAKALYRDTQIPLDQPLFAKSDLVQSAMAGMGGRADTSDANKILDVIKKSGVNPEQTHLSLADFQGLRAKISDAFATAGIVDPNSLNIAEGLASKAYGSMGDASKGTIRANFGDEVLDKYAAAQAFWRDTSQARDSALGRSLLQRGDILDSTLGSMASGIAKGNVDELNQFKKFVGYIGEKNPEVAQLAIQNMAGAMKNALVVKHTKGGQLDHEALLSDLINGAQFKKLPFPVESLGFGSVETLKDWRSVLREFKPDGVTARDMESMLANPEVQNVLAVGGKDAKQVLRRELAQQVYRDKAYTEAALAAAGVKSSASDANKFAAKAKIDEDFARKTMADIQANPILSAFTGKGSYKLTNEMAKTGEGTITHLVSSMTPDNAGKLMNGLRKNDPQLAELVERRILTDELGKLSKTDRRIPGSTERLDLAEVSAYFNPSDRSNSRLAFLENTVSDASLKKMKSLATKLATIEDDTRRGKFPTDKELQSVVDSMSLSAAAAGSKVRPGLMITILGRLRDTVSKKAYNVLSAAMTNPEVANSIFDTSKSLGDAISSLPTQKAFLLANDMAFQEDAKKLEGLPNWRGRAKPQTAP